MRPLLHGCLLAGAMGVMPAFARAQWGVRATILHFEQHTPRGGFNWLVGVDHDPSTRTSIGLDFISSLSPELSGIDLGREGEGFHQGYAVLYQLSRISHGLQYRSMFFLSDNTKTAFYLGPYLGFRRTTREVEVYAAYGGPNMSNVFPSWARPTTASATLFPIGLRMGFRNNLEGVFQDLHMSVGYQIGHGNERSKEFPGGVPYLEERDVLSGISIQLAYVLGVGW